MRKAKIAILVCIVLIGGAALASLWVNIRGREASGEREEGSQISTDGAGMRLEKIRFVEDKQGRKTWELEAKLVQHYEEQNMMILQDVKVTFYTKEGGSFVISGNKGKVHQDSKNMELVGDVHLATSDGYHLKTHSIAYDHSEKKVTTSDPVEIEGREIQMVGKGMVVDMEAKIMRVLHQVKTRWKGGEG
jgi:LPS export ABC transporter protein LptC